MRDFVLLVVRLLRRHPNPGCGVAWFSSRGDGLRAVSEGLVYKNMSLAIRILAMLVIASIFNAPADFVYKAF